MQVCRTRDECPQGFSCYPSRRSLNSHFCAPHFGTAVVPEGGACTTDEECFTALCHEGFCRDVCTRPADCTGGMVCRAEIRVHAYIGNEIATGVCVPPDPARLPPGSSCTSGAQCQHGVCGQSSATGPYLCRQPCGSQGDCPFGQRCAASVYNNNPAIGYGFRACSEQPATATADAGNFCYSTVLGGWYDAGCTTFFCDSTYCADPNSMDSNVCLIQPYCNTLCNQDDDCPEFLPEYDPSLNLRMRCLVTSSAIIQPLISGYCVPHWCNTNSDCPSNNCYIFNTGGAMGMPQGICND